MFEKLFSYSAVLRRHRSAPLAAEREAFLEMLEAKGVSHGTLLRNAQYCRCLTEAIPSLAARTMIEASVLDAWLVQWAQGREASGRASGPKWPLVNARFIATEFLRFVGLLPLPPPTPMAPKAFEREVVDFVTEKQLGPWQSAATCKSELWQINRFLLFLEQRSIGLRAVTPATLDVFFGILGQRWSRRSLHSSATALRVWFAHCEARGWVQGGVAASILVPQIYREEGIPIGPPWENVGQMLAGTLGNDPQALRDHAVLMLLSVYGLRSGEVRRLELEDINWREERIRVTRSKSGRVEWLPLEASVGNALARYLHQGRPTSANRTVFLTLRTPLRPLSPSGLYYIVKRQYHGLSKPGKGCGPHGLRHACARHLIESGMSFKQTGDHLGHRCPDSTRIYAKVDLASLRRVAFATLGGLS